MAPGLKMLRSIPGLSVRMSVCLFVRSFVIPSRSWNYFKILRWSFKLKWDISHQPLIRKHSYLDHRYPRRLALSRWLLTPGSMPQGGARGQNLGHLKKVFFYFSVMETTCADSWSDMTQPCDMDLWAWSEGKHDLYCTGQWFCLISWRLFDVWISYFGIMSQYDTLFDFKIK